MLRGLIRGGLAAGAGAMAGARQAREAQDERERQQALMEMQRTQMADLRAERERQAARQAQQDALQQFEGGYRPVEQVNERGRGLMGAESTGNPMMDMGVQFAGAAQAGARGIGDTGLVKGDYSVAEQRDRTQAQMVADRDARAAAARAAERGEDRALLLDRDEAARTQAERMARLQAGLQSGRSAPNLTAGNDGYMYRYDNGRMVRVPIDGMPSAGGGDAGRSVEIPAVGPRRDAVRPQAPGDTMFRGMGLQTAPRPQSPAPSFSAPEPRGPFGKAPAEESGLPSTDGGRIAYGFLTRMESANPILDDLERQGVTAPSWVARAKGALPFVGAQLKNNELTEMEQEYWVNAQDWVRAKLRKESGAVIGEQEMADEVATYFPMPGDKPPTIERKRQLRKIATAGMAASAGQVRDVGTLESDFPGKRAEITQARQEGYTDDQIRSFLSGGRP